MIEHQMGAYTDCNHGMGLGVIHPAYYRRICRDGIKKFVKFAVNVWGMSPDGGDEEELAFGGIDALQAFIQEIGLPGTLQGTGDHRSEPAENELLIHVSAMTAGIGS